MPIFSGYWLYSGKYHNMENQLLQHIILTETLSKEMKDVVEALIKSKTKTLHFIKSLFAVHSSLMLIVLAMYHNIIKDGVVLGSIVVMVNVGLNVLLLNSIRVKGKQLSHLKSILLAN